MLNMLDLVLAGLMLFYLLKNAGGVIKTAKNIIVVLVFLVLLAVVARALLDQSFVSGSARRSLEGSYFVKMSCSLIKWAYPTVENNAPKFNAFMKERVLSAPTEEVKLPKVTLDAKKMPKLEVPKETKPPKITW